MVIPTDINYPGPLADSALYYIITQKTLATGLWTNDAQSMFFVIPHPDTSKSGFCSSHCGFHTSTNYQSQRLRYGYVGSPKTDGSCNGCIDGNNRTVSPNNNVSIDAALSVLFHEIVETQTDPDLMTWLNTGTVESADLCSWVFTGAQFAAGYKYNITLGNNKRYLIQANWINNNGGSCGVS